MTSNIISIYIRLQFREHLKKYLQKHYPDMYQKYFARNFWDGKIWEYNFFSTFDLVDKSSDEKLNKLTLEYSQIKIFYIFQTVALFLPMYFFSFN
ncbi:MAG: hypothetical protein HND52_11770 [Ignavibacteriae bacterium]|nr:hypothetical protein [Ignavibacteriota bacterium]